MNWLLNRLQEPSTGAGLAMLAMVAKLKPEWKAYSDVFDGLAAIGATHAVVMPEKAKQ